ncbi:MAG: carbohydrate ABC transporter permease [Oscillospiraceae bacterium]|nr:carbohydrate ABC transporter permease [Oscillospiraceae bacterium]
MKQRNNKIRFSAGSTAMRWLLRIILYGWAVTIIFPLFWTLATSLKSSKVFMQGDVWNWPDPMYLTNFFRAWQEANMGAYTFNTLFVTVLTVVLFAIMLTTTSYILAKYDFKFVKFFEKYYFVSMMIPGMLLLVPLFFQLRDVGDWLQSVIRFVTGNPNYTFVLTDNLITLSVVYAVTALPTPIFLLTGFMRGIDKSFLEAARIDGASEMYIFTRIVLPFVKPIVLFQCLTQFMGTWNEYMTALTFLENEKNYTLSVGIQKLIAQFGYQSDYGAVFAGLIISLLPILLLYVVFQKTIQNGTDMSEGIK